MTGKENVQRKIRKELKKYMERGLRDIKFDTISSFLFFYI